ncbi:MAG: hypothetical protein LBO67_09920, partial [Spirochaetaceae bacterium]|nr:hypothetical protein [Spirochaetaceae bacterium]
MLYIYRQRRLKNLTISILVIWLRITDEDILYNFDELKESRKKHETNWEEVQKYVAPVMLSFSSDDGDHKIP